MLSQEENALLTQVGPGTPGGAWLRRYWHPVAAASELTAKRPLKRVRILGEDLVLYRVPLSPTLLHQGGGGQPPGRETPAASPTSGGEPSLPRPRGSEGAAYGLLGEHCSHRGTSLYYGFLEEGGLRCPYHGWLYDQTGRCLEQPFEPAQSLMKHTLRHPAYPVQELGGLLFAYLGPPDKQPLLPRWDILAWTHGRRRVERLETLNCNWLQAVENTADFVHTYFLHAHTLKQMGRPQMAASYLGRPFVKYGFQPCEWGLIKSWDYEGEHAGGGWGNLVVLPTMLRQSDIFSSMHWRTPVDDTHTEILIVYYDPDPAGRENPDAAEPPPVQYAAPQVHPTGEYRMDTFFSQDKMAWETQGAIVDRSVERLGYSDRGIVMVRQMIKEQIEIVQRGGNPRGLVWEPAANTCIELEAMTSPRDEQGGARPRGAELPGTQPREAVFDARHEVFDVPYGAARPR